ALLGFYVALAVCWWRGAPVRCVLALLCATAGLAADLSGQGLSMGVSPRIRQEAFATAEEVTGVLTGYVANSLYTLGGVLLVGAGAPALPRRLLALSAVVWAAGVALGVAALLRSPAGQVWSTAVLMAAFVLWSALMGRWLNQCAS